jgi:hypothetical protein
MTTPFSQLNFGSVEHVWVEYHIAESKNSDRFEQNSVVMYTAIWEHCIVYATLNTAWIKQMTYAWVCHSRTPVGVRCVLFSAFITTSMVPAGLKWKVNLIVLFVDFISVSAFRTVFTVILLIYSCIGNT